MNVISDDKLAMIVHYHLRGLSIRQIMKATNTAKETVRSVIKRTGIGFINLQMLKFIWSKKGRLVCDGASDGKPMIIVGLEDFAHCFWPDGPEDLKRVLKYAFSQRIDDLGGRETHLRKFKKRCPRCNLWHFKPFFNNQGSSSVCKFCNNLMSELHKKVWATRDDINS